MAPRSFHLATFPSIEDDQSKLVPGGPPLVRRPDWITYAEQADAWREAALAALPLDIDAAMTYLASAARAYQAADVPYGLFLQALSRESGTDAAWSAGRYIQSSFPQRDSKPERGRSDDALTLAAQVPAQQLVLLFAAASDVGWVEEHRQFGEWLSNLPQARSSAAFGSSGVPFSEWWAMAIEFFRMDASTSDRRDRIRDRIGRIATTHGELLGQAQLDRFHWRSGRARVALVDLDLAAVICLINRRLQAEEGMPLSMAEFEEITQLGKVSLQIGLEMASGDDPRPTDTKTPQGS
jgi:hypothetical protein